MDNFDKLIDTGVKVKDALKDYEELVKDTGAISFEQFEKCTALAKDLVKATSLVYELVDKGSMIPEELYVNVIRLHNTAVDYIEAMKDYM